MKKLIAVLFLLALVITTFIVANNSNQIPTGWFPSGNNNAEYEIGIDNSIYQNGRACAYLKSKSPKENEFGNLMQSISSEKYLGKRLKLSGYIKSDNVEGWIGMWMRIDGDNNNQLGFDNMHNRQIKGTTDWKKYEIVLDIPSNSKFIHYGVMLGGKGKVWIDNLRIEEVNKSVPVTNLLTEPKLPVEPINMDFEE